MSTTLFSPLASQIGNRAKALRGSVGTLASRGKRQIFGDLIHSHSLSQRNMTDSYNEIEAHIQAALAFISNEENPNIVKLSQDYVVPESRLRARYKG